MKTIVVVGAGITGLCAMYRLQKELQQANQQARLVLIEKEQYVGGKIHSAYEDSFIMETGADSMVARHPGVLEFIHELGFSSELVYNETGVSYIHTNNELHAIPAGSTFGIPMSVEALMASTLISEEGKQRALQDLELTENPFTKETAIGTFLEYFLGEEIVRKQIAPVLTGVYSGDLYQLSISSTLPYLVEYKNNYGSIIKGFEANREQFEKSASKKFIAFRNGLSSFMNHIEQSLTEVDVKKGVAIKHVTKIGERYKVTLETEVIEADVVVLAIPNEVVRTVLGDEQLDEQLARFTTASAITLYAGYDVPDSVLPADGTGFIVSHNSDLVCNASTWTSRKWKHTSAQEQLLVRLFYKNNNPRYEELATMSDEALAAVAQEDIRKSLGIEEAPTTVKVTRWINQMPRYDLAHHEALTVVKHELETRYPNLLLAGCSYFGVGIGACIQNGEKTARTIFQSIQ